MKLASTRRNGSNYVSMAVPPRADKAQRPIYPCTFGTRIDRNSFWQIGLERGLHLNVELMSLQQRTVAEAAHTTFEIQMAAVIVECDFVENVDEISTTRVPRGDEPAEQIP